MNQTHIILPDMKLVGISARTNNAAEVISETAIIGSMIKRFFGEKLHTAIQHITKPERFLAVYTDYESDFHGEYTYFIGAEVSEFEDVKAPLITLVIPPQPYTCFTSQPGPMPDVVISMWQRIWEMNTDILGGERAYRADFEVYDARSQDLSNAVVDVCIGLRRPETL